jgi:hypothetical protein
MFLTDPFFCRIFSCLTVQNFRNDKFRFETLIIFFSFVFRYRLLPLGFEWQPTMKWSTLFPNSAQNWIVKVVMLAIDFFIEMIIYIWLYNVIIK